MIDPLHRRVDFDELRQRGTYRRSGPLAVRYVASTRAEGSVGVAYAINKSVGGAVVRNKMRRRLRAILTALASENELPSGHYLLIVSPQAVSEPFERLRYHLEHLVVTGRSIPSQT